jgi:UTP---glucose-1-phosphate uridylyltransferase
MMQSIADYIVDDFPRKIKDDEQKKLHTFLTYNERRKTISAAKKNHEPGKSLVETPEGCFYELMQNYRELLTRYCNIDLPPQESENEYIAHGPSFIALFHPALGGIYSVVGQKIQGGRVARNAEWIMEIAEAEIKNIDLQGSLIIKADSIMGKKDSRGELKFNSTECGKCILINVKVSNKGIEAMNFETAWKQQPARSESLSITLRGNAEFFAENVLFEGDLHFDVPEGYRFVVFQEGSKTCCRREKITKEGWHWEYRFDDQDRIVLRNSQ